MQANHNQKTEYCADSALSFDWPAKPQTKLSLAC